MHQNWNTFGPNGVRVPKITSGKVGACARDMVGECRKCSRIVCRVRIRTENSSEKAEKANHASALRIV
jgi:hypothetical protein